MLRQQSQARLPAFEKWGSPTSVEPSAVPGVRAFGPTGTVALLDGPQSFYARHGDGFAWLNLLAAACICILQPVRR